MGKIPDDFINKNGKEAFEKIVYQKENIKDFIWRKYLSTVNFSIHSRFLNLKTILKSYAYN